MLNAKRNFPIVEETILRSMLMLIAPLSMVISSRFEGERKSLEPNEIGGKFCVRWRGRADVGVHGNFSFALNSL